MSFRARCLLGLGAGLGAGLGVGLGSSFSFDLCIIGQQDVRSFDLYIIGVFVCLF